MREMVGQFRMEYRITFNKTDGDSPYSLESRPTGLYGMAETVVEQIIRIGNNAFTCCCDSWAVSRLRDCEPVGPHQRCMYSRVKDSTGSSIVAKTGRPKAEEFGSRSGEVKPKF